jgi:hypothetical protein
LEQPVSQCFIGDPLHENDVPALRWYLESGYSIKSEAEVVNALANKTAQTPPYFKLPIWLPGSSEEFPRIEGTCVIRPTSDPSGDYERAVTLESHGKQLRALFYDSSRSDSDRANVARSAMTITHDDLKRHAGRESTLRRNPIRAEDLRGICLDLSDDYKERMRDRVDSQHVAFFIKNGIGNRLSHIQDETWAIFYSPIRKRDKSDFPIIAVWAYAMIWQTSRSDIALAANAVPRAYRLWSMRDYDSHLFKNYVDVNRDGRLVTIIVHPPVLLEQPMILDRPFFPRKVAGYIDDEYSSGTLSTFYIDKITAERFLDRAGGGVRPPPATAIASPDRLKSAMVAAFDTLLVQGPDDKVDYAKIRRELRAAIQSVTRHGPDLFSSKKDKVVDSITEAQIEQINLLVLRVAQMYGARDSSEIDKKEKRNQLATQCLGILKESTLLEHNEHAETYAKLKSALERIIAGTL